MDVARELLGKVLVSVDAREGLAAGRIVETEAYRCDDLASHSCRGLTPRNRVMFGPPGHAYVYFIYGMHEMLNLVTEPEGTPGAVLIRALEPLEGLELMRARRGLPAVASSRGRAAGRELAGGPGKLARALGIRLDHNGEALRGPRLWVADDPVFRPVPVLRSPRVGISAAVEPPGSRANKLWRFLLGGHPAVSAAPQNRKARP